jgi:hypothetical protein
MTTTLVFLDTETIGLGPKCDVWEIGLIRRPAGGSDTEYSWLIRPDLATAEPTGLRIGRYYDRIGAMVASQPGSARVVVAPTGGNLSTNGFVVAADVAKLLDGATIVGAVPDFDTQHLGRMLRKYGQIGTWHYHIHCVETLAIGYLAGQGKPIPDLPVRSDDLSRLIGVEPPSATDRHTALGDARWVRDIWDKVMMEAA